MILKTWERHSSLEKKICTRNGKENFGGFRKIKANGHSDLQEWIKSTKNYKYGNNDKWLFFPSLNFLVEK